jgi:Protein of unknown function (DUF3489)
MYGSTVMANKRVIPITAGARKPKSRRVLIQASQGAAGIKIQVQLAPDVAAASTDESKPGAESTMSTSNTTDRFGSDCTLEVLAAGQAKPGDADVTASSLEELAAATRDWRMPQFVTLWNMLPGVQAVKRFENRTVAIARIWRAIERLHNEPKPKGKGAAKKKGRDGTIGSKSNRILALLQAPKGATLTALMEATGWQAHSVRGFLSGTVSKRLGLRVDSFRSNGERVYALRAASAFDQPTATCDADTYTSDREGA